MKVWLPWHPGSCHCVVVMLYGILMYLFVLLRLDSLLLFSPVSLRYRHCSSLNVLHFCSLYPCCYIPSCTAVCQNKSWLVTRRWWVWSEKGRSIHYNCDIQCCKPVKVLLMTICRRWVVCFSTWPVFVNQLHAPTTLIYSHIMLLY